MWKVLIVSCMCISGSNGFSLDQKDTIQDNVLVYRREVFTPTSPSEGSSTGDFLANYWFIFVVLILFVIIVTVFICACVFKVRKRNHHTGSLELSRKSPVSSRSFRNQRSVDEHSLPQHTTGSSSMAGGSPVSFSVGPTPIPSPQPSAASSQRSFRSQGGKRRRNHSSGHMSSSSDETIRAHDFHSSISLMSHASSQGGVHPRVARTESVSSGDRHYRHTSGRHGRHRRTISNPHIKTHAPSDDPAFYSPPSSSTHSMEFEPLSQRSSHSNSQRTLVDVDVHVHLGGENDHETRKEIAAALAESARKLAQSAANFDQEDSYSPHGRRSSSQLSHRSSLQSRRQLFPTHSSSISLGHEGVGSRSYSPLGPPTVSLDRKGLERPHHNFPTRAELVRRNSQSRAPPPESPLRISHSKYSSQRSLSSERSPTAKLPAHMRVHRFQSLDGQASTALNQREVSLDNLRNSPSPPHPPRAILEDDSSVSILNPHPHLVSASLDFARMEQSLSAFPDGMRTFSGHHSPRTHTSTRSDGVHFSVESDHGISPDSGMGNGDYGTGTESSSSTLRSSHIDRRDRLSRLSEKSVEYLDCEEDESRTEESSPRKKSKSESDSPKTRSSKSGRGDMANSMNTSFREGASNTASPPKQRSAEGEQYADTDSSTQDSELSAGNSTGSGYAATGSASSVDSAARKLSHDSHMMHNGVDTQFSYPLEKLLSQSVSYDIDCNDIGNTPLSLSMEAPRHKHYHHGNTLPYSNGSHGNYHTQQSGSYNVQTRNGYSLDSNRTRSEAASSYLRSTDSHLSYHRNHGPSLQERRYQSGSIAVDV